jgi:diaminopimelate decarboxylase
MPDDRPLLNPPFGWHELVSASATPCYVYNLDVALGRVRRLRSAFAGRFGISYAVKANPNRALLAALAAEVDGFDVSSLAEAERVRAVAPGVPISFCGPGKRDAELRSFAASGAGHLVLESLDEATSLARLVAAHGLPRQKVLLRINPIEVPRGFGARMSGRRSQFGVDEEAAPATIAAIAGMPALRLAGFHCYAATNCLQAPVLAENLRLTAGL